LNKLTKLQKDVLDFVQKDISCVQRPYARIAWENKVDEAAIVNQIRFLKKAGYIRRFGAILAHNKLGLKAKCMCVWIVPESKIKKIADLAKKQPQISHCYLRKTSKIWPYNFYTMIHGSTQKECREVIEFLVEKTKVKAYEMLFTEKQFKKTSPKYNT
jgi:siroheme decarboxylase